MKDPTAHPCGSPGIAGKKRNAVCNCTWCITADATPVPAIITLAANHNAALVAANRLACLSRL